MTDVRSSINVFHEIPLAYRVACILFLPIKLIGLIVPKNNKVWIFGCSSGGYYKDNSKYLFEYVSRMPSYRAIWLTKNPLVFNKLKSTDKECYYFYSLKGIFYSIIAKVIFISYSYDDVGVFCYLFPIKTKIVQLYHGTPLKRLKYDNCSKINNLIRFMLLGYIGRKFDYMFSSSDLATEKLNMFFQSDKKKFIVTGYPRNDALALDHDIQFLEKIRRNAKYDKVILYLPTYRNYQNNNFNLLNDFGFEDKMMTNLLKKHKAILLIKLHPEDYKKSKSILDDLQDSHSIRIISDQDIDSDVYPLLTKTDILITDYSSVYLDFLMLDRPIIFAAFDREMYESHDRGFYFNYDKVTPGYKATNWREVCLRLEDALKVDKHKGLRLKLRDKMIKYPDGRSCERVFKYLEAKLYE
jgi:CDP-glycerol glycerophosphotransferase (TagB/SpsB family)